MQVRDNYSKQPNKGFPSDRSQNDKVSQCVELLKDPEVQAAPEVQAIFKNVLKSKLIELLEGDPEVQSSLKYFVNCTIADSELKIPKRLGKVEQMLGICDRSEYEENKTAAPTLPQRIKGLEEKINSPNFKPPAEIEFQPTTNTEERAVVVYEEGKKSGNFLSHPGIMSVLTNKLPDSCKLPPNIKNIRKVKQDVLKKVKELFPDVVLSPYEHGHHQVRMIIRSPT